MNPTDLVKELTKVLKFLPLRKLTANQTFDLFWDVVSLTFVIAVLFTKDVGPGGIVTRLLAVVFFIAFTSWSLVVNTR
ncbi:MAG: hypothetical protein DMG89_02185 [Acidobacteria bacterium]|nr:MAG: hypothetical protein DMG89_02185 [Acidobacteriota bacterium]